ncbi:MAG: hypothetical protein HY909_05070 [Deltaproteobacteria bacterium]|nr:hypothetical protein [Deltaproteobacteria bacterium]
MHTRALVLLGAGLSFTATAWAQPATPSVDREREEAIRAELISQAEQASDGGDHTRAVDLASRAGAIRMTPSLRLLLAQEHNALGHTIDAYEFATRCVREAQADPNTRNRERVVEACNALVEDLRNRVGRVTIQVSNPPPGLQVRVAGGEVSQALWGIPYTVTPGTVVVEATAEWYNPFRREVTVAAGENVDVGVTLVRGPGRPPPPGGGSGGGGGGIRPYIGPIAVGGAGVLSLVLSGVFFGLRNNAVSNRDEACSADGCFPRALDFDARARTFNTLTNVTLGLGAAAVVGAGVWFFLSRPRGQERARATLTGSVVPTDGGLLLGLGGVL